MARHIRYLGFMVHSDCREYTMAVRSLDLEAGWSEVAVLIAHDTFLSGRLRYQDAPTACFRILQEEAASCEGWEPPKSLVVDDEHLRVYNASLPPRRVPYRRRSAITETDETREDAAGSPEAAAARTEGA